MDTTFLTFGVILIVIGFLLLAADLFITSGALMVIAVGCVGVGLVFVFKHDTTAGLIALACVGVVLPLGVTLLLKLWPHTAAGRRLLSSSTTQTDTMAELPLNKELEQLKGRYGRTISALRPAGVVDFEGRRIDSLSEGMMIDPGQWVRCIDVSSGKVVVRLAERPGPDVFETDLLG